MYHSYKTDYPNQVHQLNYSISQNYHVLKSGEIKYQEKKFDVNWKNYEKTGKRHLVNFLVRDHFSNCFYAEIFPIDETPHIREFLFNAWRRKDTLEFCGIPKTLILGRHVMDKFPDLENLQSTLGLNIELATNGFATGIRSLRDWESSIKFYTSFQNNETIADFQGNIEHICRSINLRDSGKTQPNFLKWTANEPRGKLVNDKQAFVKLFDPQ
jgi:hypothetical protein